MEFTMEQYRESAGFLRERLGDFAPKIAMVLGSGLGYLGDQVERPIFVDYRDIPHFKASTAPGHKSSAACSASSSSGPPLMLHVMPGFTS